MGTLATGVRKVDVSTRVTQAPHERLGLTPDHLLRMHRSMVTARLIDEASLRQNRMGRAPFVVPVSGHEGCQIGTAAALVPGVDVWVPYYRDLGVVLVAGLTPYEVFLGVFSKADDPASGGRQMPSHWGSRRLQIVSHSSPIATQVPHAAGIAYAVRYRDGQARGGGGVRGRGGRGGGLVGGGGAEGGGLARGPELRRDPQAPGPVRLREQRV